MKIKYLNIVSIFKVQFLYSFYLYRMNIESYYFLTILIIFKSKSNSININNKKIKK